ncbi:hypothetical protein HQ531_11145 [bacterium]|nr:hypothetical protein [bacterium]
MNRRSTIGFLSAIFALICLFILSCGPAPETAPEEVVVDPLRFSNAIAEFHSADSIKKPRPNSVLFIGSSSIHGWKSLAADFPELNTINRGFGGSHMSDLIYFMDDIVFPYYPNAVVVYEGDNDIASGKTPQQVFEDYQTFVTKLLSKWPTLPIFFISIKPSLARIEYLERMAQANALIKAHTELHESLYYVDVFSLMLDEDGQPRPEIFSDDGLHMNSDGYVIWTKEVKKELGL